MSLLNRILLAAFFAIPAAFSQDRWVVWLDAPPAAERMVTRAELTTQSGAAARQAVVAQQAGMRQILEAEPVEVIGASQLLVNAIYMVGDAESAARLRRMPGVRGVVRMRRYRRLIDDAATGIVNAPQAWSTLGGESNAGAGRRIGILDSGIDHMHPAFQDPSLTVPAGFPRVNADADRTYTNNKIIVARSYVSQLVLGQFPRLSRPDDISARDRDGHGTAVASIAAGVRVTGPAATITGVAPKAFLGSYKIFGSPGVNDMTFVNVIIRALEDAVTDGMDVVTLSLAAPAAWGAVDRCGNSPCDPLADAIHQMARMNTAIVVAAGNTGDTGFRFPGLGTTESPGTAPDAITVGAITNGNIYLQQIRVEGTAALREIETIFGNGPLRTVTARATYVARIGDDGRACRPLGNGTLSGRIAVIDRGDCARELKVNNAQRAGAVAAIIVQPDGVNELFQMTDLQNTGIPATLIRDRDGDSLKQQLDANANIELTLDPEVRQLDAAPNEIAVFSSQGPTMFSLENNNAVLKPELTAVGTDLYSAAQKYDPNGGGYSPTGYLAVNGTSFSTPMVAGAVALVRQRNPTWTAAQLKSAVTNSANPAVDDFDENGVRFQARVNSTGAGKLDANQALMPSVTADPAMVFFGVAGGGGIVRNLRLTNMSNAPVQLQLQVDQRDPDSNSRVTIDQGTQLSIPPNQTSQISVRLSGLPPAAGSYEGVIRVTGAGSALRIPYEYLVGDGVPFNIYPLGNFFTATPGAVFDEDDNPLLARVTDRYGVPVGNARVRWQMTAGGGSVDVAGEFTDPYGVAFAGVTLGPAIGDQAFRVDVGNISQTISVRTIAQPAIREGGVVDAASGRAGNGLAPGSYISIFGSGLSPVTQVYSTPYLPVSLTGVSVSFDNTAAGISAPGRLHFVSDGQVNVQIPWELRNQTSAEMKVSIGGTSSELFTVRLNEFSPGVFEYDDGASGRRLAAALDETNVVISGSNPVERGRVAQLYVNGLGRVVTAVPSGEPASLTQLNPTVTVPEVRIGGVLAPVQFSGLAPGFVGLYQVNVQVPAGVPTGIQPLVISTGGQTSQTSQIAVR